MPISSNNEVTVKVKCTYEELEQKLKNKGFKELDKYFFTDIFLIPTEINIYKEEIREILKKAILLREAKGINTNRNSKKITFKQKNINDNGEIISQLAIKCAIDNIEDAQKLFMAIGYKKIMEINELHISYEKDNFKIIVKNNINNGYILIEAETNDYYKTIEELKSKISEIDGCIDLTDIFVKKAEIELRRIKDKGELKNG